MVMSERQVVGAPVTKPKLATKLRPVLKTKVLAGVRMKIVNE